MKHIILVLALSIMLFNCNDAKKELSYASIIQDDTESIHLGKKLMETNCYTCHNPTTSHDDRIGPPMIAIKKHYLKEGITKETFINDIQNWIKNPTEDNAKMHGAVRRFGVMPKQVFPEETIQLISEYMYENDIEEPEWFEDHFKSNKGKRKGL